MDQFRRGDLTFDVRDGGPTDGEAVVLLHGFPQDSTCWTGIEPLLHDAGLRTLAPDQRGYSPGARPWGRWNYTGDQLASDIVALLDAAGLQKAHVVGHDWGGGVAWGLASRHAHRISTVTVLSTPHPGALVRSALTSSQGLKSWYMFAMQPPFLPEAILGRADLAAGLTRAGLPAHLAEHHAAKMAEPGALSSAMNWYRALPFSLAKPIGPSLVPTTYVWSNEDAYLGRTAALATAQFVKAPYRFVEVDGNHWLPETMPVAMAEFILDRVSNPVRPAAASAA